jgi:hypothetical protein
MATILALSAFYLTTCGQSLKVSGLGFQVSGMGSAHMKLHEIRCHFHEVGRATVPAGIDRHDGRP